MTRSPLHLADRQIGQIYSRFEPDDASTSVVARFKTVERHAAIVSRHSVHGTMRQLKGVLCDDSPARCQAPIFTCHPVAWRNLGSVRARDHWAKVASLHFRRDDGHRLGPNDDTGPFIGH